MTHAASYPFNALVLAAILSLSQPALAVGDFSGHWFADEGTVSSNLPGLSAKCTRVEIVIEQSTDALIAKRYEADCGMLSTKWGPVREDIRGNEVLENGEVVGSISDDTLITVSPSGTAYYAFNLKLIKGPQGETLLQSYYGTKNGPGAIATEAILSRKD